MPKKLLLNRRNALKLSLGTLAGLGSLALGKDIYSKFQIQALADARKDFTVRGRAALKQRAAAKGIIYGAAMRQDNLSANTKLAARFVQECGILVPELELKWAAGNKLLRPNIHSFDFAAADWMNNFAKTHDLLFRGHTLIWHNSLPSWFKEKVNRQNAEQLLVKHIKTVAGRYAGEVHSWDVVNEAIAHDPTQGRSDRLRQTPWLEFIGPDYIDLAFRVAAKADPKALLVYNDYGMDYDSRKDEAKRNAVLKLLERLKSKGTPIHALGIQAHLWGSATPGFKPKKVRDFLRNVASLGLKILITELEVVDKDLPANNLVRDRIVARAYEDYLSVALDERAVIAVLTWGLSDRYTYASEFYPRADAAPVRPLPLDADLKPKLAWQAIARAFDGAPKR